MLEAEGLPVGVVTGISGATRLLVTLEGLAGHAGTVPMAMRRDALAGAAECITAIESQCKNDSNLFGTVGVIRAEPGAANVIPGRTTFTLDMRSASDEHRLQAVSRAVHTIEGIAQGRRLVPHIEVTYEQRRTPCAGWLQAQVSAAIPRHGCRVLSLPSGAGNDGMAIAEITDIGMIFVRCRGGISHHPDEHVTLEDTTLGATMLLDVIERFEPKHAASR
jgi:allantoate deiminase